MIMRLVMNGNLVKFNRLVYHFLDVRDYCHIVVLFILILFSVRQYYKELL